MAKQFDFGHQFLYVDNDADRLLYAARFMVVVLGVVLGVLLSQLHRRRQHGR